MERTSPQVPGDKSLQRLLHFSQDLDQITELRCLTERILLEFCRTMNRPEGSLYLLTQSPQRFHRLAIQGSTQRELLPSTIMLDHPLVQRLQRRLDPTPRIQDTSLATECHLRSSGLDCSVNDMVIPFCCRNHLLAFIIILGSEQHPNSLDLKQPEILPLMTQIAATSLNSTLIQDLHLRVNTLMRCTNRLQTLESMADNLAHAVRNPLTSIKTFIQLAGERRDDPQFVSNFSQMALDDVYRLERLTQETFDYIRYRKPNPTEEDVNDIVSSCLYFFELTIKHRRIKIEKDLASGPHHGMVDKQQIQQTLFNLLFNAVEALEPHGGLVRIRTRRLMRPNGTVWSHIDIEDTGQGISPENLERIFDPFFTTKHQEGDPKQSGLGLTIAKQIIDAHQGKIHVQSVEGAGTTFSIHLPLCTV